MKVEIRGNQVLLDGYVNTVLRDSRPLPSPRGKFIEQIEARVFEKALNKAENVELLFNHNSNRKLGSVKDGNLELFEDSIGLRAICTVTDEEVIQKAKEGKLKGWSFGFITNKDRWEDTAKGIQRRFIEDMDLLEVSILDMTPAYIATSIEARGEETVIRELRNDEFRAVTVDLTPKEPTQEVEERVEPAKVDYTLQDLELYVLKGGKQ